MQKLTKNHSFLLKLVKNLAKAGKRISFFPEKKCHLIWKIAIFFENFGIPFSEKWMLSAKSVKSGYVPN